MPNNNQVDKTDPGASNDFEVNNFALSSPNLMIYEVKFSCGISARSIRPEVVARLNHRQ